MPGIFVSRGARFNIPEFEITESPEGVISGPDSITLHLSYDMYPQWLRVAVEHAESAILAAAEVDRQWATAEEDARARSDAIEAEQRAAMQSMVAAAVAFDGLFGMIEDVAPLPATVKEAWRTNGTKRSARVAAGLRHAFRIPNAEFKKVRQFLDQLFRFRDIAVHPASRAEPAIEHPRINTGVEPRFVIFRAENAVQAAGQALDLIRQLLDVPRKKHAKLTEHCEFAKEWVSPVAAEWAARHGAPEKSRA